MESDKEKGPHPERSQKAPKGVRMTPEVDKAQARRNAEGSKAINNQASIRDRLVAIGRGFLRVGRGPGNQTGRKG